MPRPRTAALVGSILADEIAFRSQLLERVQWLEQLLVHALNRREYDPERATLPQLIREHRATVELSLRIVDSTRHLDPKDAAGRQVSGLVARFGLLRDELKRRGIVDDDGNVIARLPAGSEAGPAPPRPPGDPEDARHPGGAPPPAASEGASESEQGVSEPGASPAEDLA